ncbi:MAG: long-chain fatty acid--CoA ligase [Firmicutes bacterium]|nr:long-chain fatty acid--CoA ligase [Bacillota bacterium]
MNSGLTIQHMFDYATTYFPDQTIVCRKPEGTIRLSYQEFGHRTRRLAAALMALGVGPGDRVGTFLWNDLPHLEAYFAVPLIGGVLHTINIRLPADQLLYLVNHPEDRVLIVDRTLWPALAPLRERLTSVTAIILTGRSPDPDPLGTLDYDTILEETDGHFDYPAVQETMPMGLCYTSATTGNPKGVLYSHRGMYLHSLTLGLANTLGISLEDTVLPIVPMFHVNAWGIPFAAVWFGAKMVLPGPAPQASTLLDLMRDESVTLAAGVPTVWLSIARELEARPTRLALRAAVAGGSAAPATLIRLFESTFRIPFIHAYGMTETSPLVTVSRLKPHHRTLSDEEQLAIKATQGFLVPGLAMKLERDQHPVPWDGESVGELCLQGPWIADEYYRDPRTRDTFIDGWLHTGDLASVTQEGYVHLRDRTKDVIKSGGEWISSVDLENALMAHPAVFEAAVVSVPHPQWGERPLAFVVVKEGRSATQEELRKSLRDRFAKWQLPDGILFVPEIPKSSVGKFLKRALRDAYRDYFQPSSGE